jgi:tetratricopeptide (TPR) repeat protein
MPRNRNVPFRLNGIGVLALALAATLAFATASYPQLGGGTSSGMNSDPRTSITISEIMLNSNSPKASAPEEKAYKAFYDARTQSPDKRIQLATEFVQRYPTSRYADSVYSSLVQAYYAKQDWNDFYGSAEKALALNPDNVDVLAIVGWEIPHNYDPNDPDAEKKLAKAETYEKRAVSVISTLPKPASIAEEQFVSAKAERLAEAHSALGAVYFRRKQFEEAAKEFQQATQGPNPDPVDIYSLGVSYHNMERYGDAAEAFGKCAQIPGTLQDRCKQNADASKKHAGAAR